MNPAPTLRACEGGGGDAAAPGLALARWLRLAPTPIFAVMAGLAAHSGAPDGMCGAMGASPLGGMAAMYLLMSVFHAAPWLGLALGRKPGGAGQE